MDDFVETLDGQNVEAMSTMAEGDDEPINEFKHDRMLEAIRNIGGRKRLIVSQRTEYAPVSEFSLGSKVKVHLNDLLGSLGKTVRLSNMRMKTKQASSKGIRTLPIPLETPEANKIGRVVTYENVCQEVSKWDRVVFQNRSSEQVVFPLNQPSMRMETSREVVQRFKLATPLEQEVAALLASRHPAVPDPSPSEYKALSSRRALDEAKDMRREMQIMRAKQSYREAKARYQKKIKSKRYHRILKKERAKKEVKDFEALQKTNPELAQEKLDQIERQRIVERMTLRHRNTGKWAREQIIKFKNDKESGRAVQEQIDLGRHLTAKLHEPSDSENDGETGQLDDGVTDSRELQLSQSDVSNPWMNSGGVASNSDAKQIAPSEDEARKELLVGYRKFWEEDNRKRVLETKRRAAGDTNKTDDVTVVDENEARVHCRTSNKSKKKVMWKESENNIEGISSVKKKLKEAVVKSAKSVDVDKDEDCKRSPVTKAKKKVKKGSDKVEEKKLKKGSGTSKETKLRKKPSRNVKVNKAVNSDVKVDEEFDEVDQIFQYAAAKKTKLKSETAEATSKGRKEKKREVVETIRGGGDVDDNEKSRASRIINETLVRKRRWEDFDKQPGEETQEEAEEISVKERAKPAVDTKGVSNGNVGVYEDVAIDPHNFIVVKERTIKCRVPDELDCYDDEAMDDRNDGEEHRMTIAEAFADDDVVGEFKAEKNQAVLGDKPKDIDLTLPGWGEWGGKGLDISMKKRNRFIIKAPKGPPRKDHQLGHVILSEKAENAVKSLQVVKVPFPFRDANDFEKNLAVPIGKQWNPETAFRRLIAPKVVTKMGAIIEPIDADFLQEQSSRNSTNTRGRIQSRERHE